MADTTNMPIIFLAFANDRDDTVGYLRNLPDEARRLRDVLQAAEQAGIRFGVINIARLLVDGLDQNSWANNRCTFPGAPPVNSIRDAASDTIVNGKNGLRYSTDRGSIYAGYGKNWTGPRWYSDLRLELSKNF